MGWVSLTLVAPWLLGAQRHCRIDPHRPPGGDIARQKGHRREHGRRHHERERVGRTDPVELVLERAREHERAKRADGDATDYEPHSTSDDHPEDVAGTRPEVLRAFSDAVARNGLERVLDHDITLIHGRDFKSYYETFNRALLRTDVLWTKPSELSFYPALGLACMLSRPLGAHERYNRRWLREQGVGLKHRRLDYARGWFEEWLEDGTLAGAAWSGFVRLPKHGTERIVQLVLERAERRGVPLADAPLEQHARAT